MLQAIATIARATSRYAFRQGARHLIREQRFWRGLYGPKGRYPGVSQYRQAAKGVQHGLLGGSIAGSFINDGSTPYESGPIKTNYPYKKGNSRFNSSRRGGRRQKYSRRCNCSKRLHRRSRYRRGRF